MRNPNRDAHGPFRPEQLAPGDRYELSDGHPIYAAPGGGDHARATSVGIQALATDPAVESAGVDAGFKLGDFTLRAPDVAIGGVPDKSGWISGAPPLAVEYAGVGQDEEALQVKIAELFGAGTRYVWVVRLVGPRRVEVYEPEGAVRVLVAGDVLAAPGVLQNEVPVEALYDRDAAYDVTLRNLLQRQGYPDLDAVRVEGYVEGTQTALREALLDILAARSLLLSEQQKGAIEACTDVDRLRAWLVASATAASAEEALRQR